MLPQSVMIWSSRASELFQRSSVKITDHGTLWLMRQRETVSRRTSKSAPMAGSVFRSPYQVTAS